MANVLLVFHLSLFLFFGLNFSVLNERKRGGERENNGRLHGKELYRHIQEAYKIHMGVARMVVW